MRHAWLVAGVVGGLLLGSPAGADTSVEHAGTTADGTGTTAGDAGTTADRAARTVDYQGLRITVPAGWPVYRLGPGSTECVRFDRHAIYLGPAGENALCPAHAVGRTEAIHIEPLAQQTNSFVSGLMADSAIPPTAAARMRAGSLPGLTVRDPDAREVRIAVPAVQALITGSYGAGPRELDRVLAGITMAPAPEPLRPSAAVRRSTLPELHRWVTGYGFDTCEAPSLEAMQAWRDDFVATNIYIGGAARACPNTRLSRQWVSAVRAMGWRLIPTYVGPQAPCTAFDNRFSRRHPVRAGRRSARDAVRRARALGLRRHTPIYVDLEAYDMHNPSCTRAVLRYLDAWTRGLRSRGYLSGVYSSVASGIRDLGRADGIRKPSAIWFAHWDRRPDPHDDEFVEEEWWPGHRRIKQYRGDHVEKHGGFRLHIDSDAVDGYVR